jgi:peptidoglycan/LPS O-acetylase OafA/YrhL
MKEIPEVTGMRGFASLGVVIFHFFVIDRMLSALPIPGSTLVLSWNSGVDFFFVLSGFLLSIPFMSGERLSLRAYYTKRIFRIFPVYYLSVIILGTTLFFYGHHDTLQQIGASLVFVQSFSPSTFNSINGVNWTLVIEEIFYVTLPMFSFFFVRNRWRYALPVCILIALLYRFEAIRLYSNNDLSFHLWQYPSFIGHYAIGVTLGNLYVTGKLGRIAGRLTSLPLILTIGALIGTQYYVAMKFSIFNNVALYPGIIFAAEYGALLLFSLTLPASALVKKVFTNRPVSYAGKISYSTYTWHLPIETALSQMGLPVFEWIALSLFAILSIATISFYLVERPFLALRTRFLPTYSSQGKGAKGRGRKEEERRVGPLGGGRGGGREEGGGGIQLPAAAVERSHAEGDGVGHPGVTMRTVNGESSRPQRGSSLTGRGAPSHQPG